MWTTVNRLVLGGLLAAWPAASQSAAAPAFEVASIKLTRHGRTADGWSYSTVESPSPGRLLGVNASVSECILWAYDVKDYQIIGPDWLNHSDDAGFDIEAKAPAGTSAKDMRAMLQTLLRERLKLTLHREERMLPVYTLVVAKGGAKLKAAAAGGKMGTNSRGGEMTATSISMDEFAYQLSRDLKRPVFDKTGLPGAFDFKLDYAPNDDGGRRPGLLTAIQEQLGLKLESGKGPVEVLVVEHAEKVPVGN